MEPCDYRQGKFSERKPPRDGTKISTGYRKAVVHCDWAVGFLFNLFTAQVRQAKKEKEKNMCGSYLVWWDLDSTYSVENRGFSWLGAGLLS